MLLIINMDLMHLPYWIKSMKQFNIQSVEHRSNTYSRRGKFAVPIIGFVVAQPTTNEDHIQSLAEEYIL